MEFQYYNPNPKGRAVEDCSIRALARATGKSWDDIYLILMAEGFKQCDMPSSNSVWGAYLESRGYRKKTADGETVAEFSESHPGGTYILALSGHVACLKDGTLYDTWNPCRETVIYYFE